MEAKLESLVARLETAVENLESQTGGSTQTGGDEVPKNVVAYDKYVAANVNPFVATCKKIGGDLDKVGDLVKEGFEEVRKVLMVASHCKKATNDQKVKLFAGVKEKVDAVVAIRNDSRGKPLFPHLSALEDGLKALFWISVRDTPVNYVKEMVGAASYNLNLVLRNFRNKDDGEEHLKFEKQTRQVILKLADYVKENHETGLRWNARSGVDFNEAFSKYAGGKAAPAPAASGSMPPPPPPPTATPPPVSKPRPVADTGALFADIQKFTTGNLRKVKREEKNKYKDPKDKVAVVKASEFRKRPTKAAPKKPPRFEYVDNKKFEIEYQVANHDLKVQVQQMSDTAYIYKCTDTVIEFDGKCSSVLLDSCVKCAVIIDAAVASVELVNCKDMKLQIKKKVPSIHIDKTDGCAVYLSTECRDIPFYTSKSSEMNMLVPSEEDPDDHIEIPLPESFVTSYSSKTKKINTIVNEI